MTIQRKSNIGDRLIPFVEPIAGLACVALFCLGGALTAVGFGDIYLSAWLSRLTGRQDVVSFCAFKTLVGFLMFGVSYVMLYVFKFNPRLRTWLSAGIVCLLMILSSCGMRMIA